MACARGVCIARTLDADIENSRTYPTSHIRPSSSRPQIDHSALCDRSHAKWRGRDYIIRGFIIFEDGCKVVSRTRVPDCTCSVQILLLSTLSADHHGSDALILFALCRDLKTFLRILPRPRNEGVLSPRLAACRRACRPGGQATWPRLLHY